MNTRHLAILLAMASSAMVWGADTKESLEKSRTGYRQAVAQYGQGSPQAKNARQHLRQTRRAFHTDRRRRQAQSSGDSH